MIRSLKYLQILKVIDLAYNNIYKFHNHNYKEKHNRSSKGINCWQEKRLLIMLDFIFLEDLLHLF